MMATDTVKKGFLKSLWRFWPWYAVACVVLYANYICNRYAYSTWNVLLCMFVLFLAILLLTLVFRTIYLRNRVGGGLGDTFGRVFQSKAVYCVFSVIVVWAISCVWQSITIHHFYGLSSGFYEEDRWSDVWEISIKGPLWEEVLYRMLPFLFASFVLAFVKQMKWRIPLSIALGVMIFCVQMQFGYRHFNVLYAEISGDTLLPHLYIQGGSGVFFALSYGIVLHKSYKLLMVKNVGRNRFLMLLQAHLLSFLASYLTHFGYNLFMIYTGTV